MSITNTKVSVLTSATSLASGSGTTLSDRRTIVVKNHPNDIYLGDSTVTTLTGMLLAVGQTIALDLGPGDILYGVAGSTTITDVLATRV